MNANQTIYKNQELKNAIRIVWQISAIISIFILLILFCFDDKIILSAVPTCEARKKGLECFFCGTTRAFIEIKNLNIKNAFVLNKFSLILFGLMLLNSIGYLLYLLKTNTKIKL